MAVRSLHRKPHLGPVLQDAVQVRRPLGEVVLDGPEHSLRRVGEDVRRVQRLVHEERVRVVARGEQQVLLLLVRLLLDLAPLDVDVGLFLHHVEELQSLVRVGLVADHPHHLQGDLLGSHRVAGVGIDVAGRHPRLLGGGGERAGRSQHEQDCCPKQRSNLFHGFSLLGSSLIRYTKPRVRHAVKDAMSSGHPPDYAATRRLPASGRTGRCARHATATCGTAAP